MDGANGTKKALITWTDGIEESHIELPITVSMHTLTNLDLALWEIILSFMVTTSGNSIDGIPFSISKMATSGVSVTVFSDEIDLSKHVSFIFHDHDWNYGFPGGSLTYVQNGFIVTDPTITEIVIETPAGKTYTVSRETKTTGSLESEAGLLEVTIDDFTTSFGWEIIVSFSNESGFNAAFGDGEYTYRFNFTNGTSKSTIIPYLFNTRNKFAYSSAKGKTKYNNTNPQHDKNTSIISPMEHCY